MRKHGLSVVLTALFLFCTASGALSAEAKNFFIGAGGSYAIENIDGGDFDNSWGGHAKFGYSFHPLADIELVVNYLDEFEDNLDGLVIAGTNIEAEASVTVTTYMVVVKGYWPLPTDSVRLSAFVGGGLMHADAETNAYSMNTFYSGSYDETDFAWEVGFGADFFASPEFSLGIEGNYTKGISDLEGLEYFGLTFGVAYHF